MLLRWNCFLSSLRRASIVPNDTWDANWYHHGSEKPPHFLHSKKANEGLRVEVSVIPTPMTDKRSYRWQWATEELRQENKLKKLYEVILILWTLRSRWGKKIHGAKNQRTKKIINCICNTGKMDLNNPKEVHTKHKIRRHFLETKSTETFCWNRKKKHQNACQKEKESKDRKVEGVFLSPVLVRYGYW